MVDIKLKVILKKLDIGEEKTEYDIIGKYDIENNYITYEEIDTDNVMVKIIPNEDKLRFIRENDEMKMDVLFDDTSETDGEYFVKQFDMHLPLKIFTDELNFDFTNGRIKVKYYLELNMENQGLFELDIYFQEVL